jgi:ATP phosphoribosyltransferase regulatory subunit HisZ
VPSSTATSSLVEAAIAERQETLRAALDPELREEIAVGLSVVRHVDPATGFVYTQYVDGSGEPVAGLSTTYHSQKGNAGFIPPPS